MGFYLLIWLSPVIIGIKFIPFCNYCRRAAVFWAIDTPFGGIKWRHRPGWMIRLHVICLHVSLFSSIVHTNFSSEFERFQKLINPYRNWVEKCPHLFEEQQMVKSPASLLKAQTGFKLEIYNWIVTNHFRWLWFLSMHSWYDHTIKDSL